MAKRCIFCGKELDLFGKRFISVRRHGPVRLFCLPCGTLSLPSPQRE